MSPADYFQRVAELFAGLRVTDARGAALDPAAGTDETVRLILAARSSGKKVVLVGNGGSSAIATHMHSDLCKSVGTRALVFHDIPLMTATINDDGYERVFAQPLELWADSGDLLIAVSSSGQSRNILRAVDAIRAAGGNVVTLSGFSPENPLRRLGAVNFWVGSENYGLVEVVHTILAHYLTDAAIASSRAEPSP